MSTAHHTKRSGAGIIHGDVADHERPYVAVVRLKWGEDWIEPGEPVPIEPGRNYASLLRNGEIQLAQHGPARKRGGR